MTDRPLNGKHVAIMVANGFEETEFTEPQKRLLQAGATVKVVSRANGLVNGWYENTWGHFFPVDGDLAETLAIDFDGLIVPGGMRSMEKLVEDAHAKRILAAFMRAETPVWCSVTRCVCWGSQIIFPAVPSPGPRTAALKPKTPVAAGRKPKLFMTATW